MDFTKKEKTSLLSDSNTRTITFYLVFPKIEAKNIELELSDAGKLKL